MLKNFRAYCLAVEFYNACGKVRDARHLCDQMDRAAASIVLNLAEGSERGSSVDQRRFYRIAMGCVRECQAILDLMNGTNETLEAKKIADTLAANVFGLCKAMGAKINDSKGG